MFLNCKCISFIQISFMHFSCTFHALFMHFSCTFHALFMSFSSPFQGKKVKKILFFYKCFTSAATGYKRHRNNRNRENRVLFEQYK